MRLRWRWFGTAAILMSAGGSSIIFDPFVSMNGKIDAYDHTVAAEADGILITHGHLIIWPMCPIWSGSTDRIFTVQEQRRRPCAGRAWMKRKSGSWLRANILKSEISISPYGEDVILSLI